MGAGKTTRAAALAAEARARGDRVAGVLSVKLFAGHSRSDEELPGADNVRGYAFEDLRTGRRVRYAVRRRSDRRRAGLSRSRYRFLRRGLRFGLRALAADADLVVIDELGPLELGPADPGRHRRAGLWPAVERLLAGSKAQLVIVVRERLLEALVERLGAATRRRHYESPPPEKCPGGSRVPPSSIQPLPSEKGALQVGGESVSEEAPPLSEVKTTSVFSARP